MGNISLVGATSGATTLQPQSTGTYTVTLPAGTGTLSLTANPTFTGVTTESTITSPAATNLTLQSAGTTAMTIDTSQNVGIGTTAPLAKLNVKAGNGGQLTLDNDGSQFTTAIWANNGTGKYYQYWDQTNTLFVNNMTPAGAFTWVSNSTERMRIDSSGNLLVGQTSDSLSAKISATSGVNTSHFITTGSANSGVCASLERNSTGLLMNFRYSGADISGASISTTGGTSVAYNTGSDYRLKNNIQTMTSGIATINALHPVTYKWNLDGSDGAGFIAHELAEHIPLAVTGEKDAINEDGSIRPQGVDYSKIVVHLVAAVQELTARIAALEAK